MLRKESALRVSQVSAARRSEGFESPPSPHRCRSGGDVSLFEEDYKRKFMSSGSRSQLEVEFKNLGIASALDQFQLLVPPNQRPYAWDKSQVERLFQDYSQSVVQDNPTYFLGTIVLTRGNVPNRFEVADGQQRLATTSILIAAIRDYLYTKGGSAKTASEKYTADYLLDYDEMEGEAVPKLVLNTEDNDFFINHILLRPDDESRRSDEPKSGSRRRLYEAAELARIHVNNVVATLPELERSKRLYQWIRFLRDNAVVIVITVPDYLDAFTMFETLNDRGLRASQVDILKNYLFSRAQDRRGEVQPHWASMTGIIEAAGEDELLVTYLRHFTITRHGPTPERLLASSFKKSIGSKQEAVDLARSLELSAVDYAAILLPLEHPRWSEFDRQSRGYISVLTNILGIEQIRPLILAIMQKFPNHEARKAFKLAVAWSVRFLIAGGGGGGVLDRHYGLRAQEITNGEINTAKELSSKMVAVVPNDRTFEERFATATVSRAVLARYYLRSLELYFSNDDAPMLGGVDDTVIYNLEHILPINPDDSWELQEDFNQNLYKRIGNMVLLRSTVNLKLANRSFSEKRVVYGDSGLLLAVAVSQYAKWGINEIEARQIALSKIAPKVWQT